MEILLLLIYVAICSFIVLFVLRVLWPLLWIWSTARLPEDDCDFKEPPIDEAPADFQESKDRLEVRILAPKDAPHEEQR